MLLYMLIRFITDYKLKATTFSFCFLRGKEGTDEHI